MTQENKLPFPLTLLVMDLFGALLAGLGLAKQFGGVDVFDGRLPLEDYGIPFIVVGVALMVPMVLHVIRMAKNAQRVNGQDNTR